MPAKSDKSSSKDKAPKDSSKRDLKAEIEKTAKLFDVAKPGETPASATSRPIIVGHTAMIKDDPMMKDKNPGSDGSEDANDPAKTHRAKSINPLDAKGAKDGASVEKTPVEEAETPETKTSETEEVKSDDTAAEEKIDTEAKDESDDGDKITVSVKTKKAEKAADATPVEETEAETLAESTEEPLETSEDPPSDQPTEATTEEPPQADEEAKEEPAESQQPAESTESDDKLADAAAEEAENSDTDEDTAPGQGVVDSLVEEANSKKENQKKEDELVARAEEAEKLINSKEFFVPIGQVSRRRSNHRIFIGLFLLLVLAAAAVNFAVDAEAVDIGVDAFTDVL